MSAPDRSWIAADLSDDDLGAAATARRAQLLLKLIEDESYGAARRVLDLILASAPTDADGQWNVLYSEYSYLSALRELPDADKRRRAAIGQELVRRFGHSDDLDLRAEVALIAATLEVSDGPSAERWLRSARRRPDYSRLMTVSQFRDGIALLERMVREDRDGGPTGPVTDDYEVEVAMLRWWLEPGAPLPQRLAVTELPAPGAVDVRVGSASDAGHALAMAAALAATYRFGDALSCVRAVAADACEGGFDLTAAFATVIEGELLVLVDRVPEAVDRLWTGAFMLREARRLDVAIQAFSALARLGATHLEVDELLADRIEMPQPARGDRLLAVCDVVRSLAELTHDAAGRWTSQLLLAQTLVTLGRAPEARAVVSSLGAPPPGPGHDAAEIERGLLAVRVLLATEGADAARDAIAAATRGLAACRPWFAWQISQLTAEVELASGQQARAWEANARARETLRSIRSVVGNEYQRASWAASRKEVWACGLKIAIARERWDDALTIVEDAKSTHLARLLLAQAASGVDWASVEIREAMIRLSTAPADLALSDAALAGRSEEAAALVQLLGRRDARVAAMLDPVGPAPDALARLGDAIGRPFVFVDYLDLGGSSIWRVVATAGGAVDARELLLSGEARETLLLLSRHVDGERVEEWLRTTPAAPLRSRLGTLRAELLVGIDLPRSEREPLVVSPSGRLGAVPWAMLPLDGDEVLVDRRPLTLLASLTLGLAMTRPAAVASAPVGMWCNPDGDLPGVARQRDALRYLYPTILDIDGADASTATLTKLDEDETLAHARRLIWAGHGRPHPDEPQASGLLLGDGTILSAAMLGAWRLPAEVELWTCSSSTERRLDLDEQLGLVAACQRAGARTVLGTLWALDEDHIEGLVRSYHERLLSGDSPADALRSAQRTARAAAVPASVWGALVTWGLPLPSSTDGSSSAAAAHPRVASPAEPLRPVAEAQHGPRPSTVLGARRLSTDPAALRHVAVQAAELVGSSRVTTGHLLLALLQDVDIASALAGAGVLACRVEGLLRLLPGLGLLGDATTRRKGPSPSLEGVLANRCDAAVGVAAVLVADSASDATEIMSHCGLEPAVLARVLSGEPPPEGIRWEPYAPPISDLTSADMVAGYERLCHGDASEDWTVASLSGRVLRAHAALRNPSAPRRLQRSLANVVIEADGLRASRPAGQRVATIAGLGIAHAVAQGRFQGLPHAGDPQRAHAIAAARTALAMAQTQALLKLQAECHLLLCDLLLHDGLQAPAVQHGNHAVALLTLLGQQGDSALAEVTLGHAKAGLGRSCDYTILSAAYDAAISRFDQLGDTDVAEQLRATLSAIIEQQ